MTATDVTGFMKYLFLMYYTLSCGGQVEVL